MNVSTVSLVNGNGEISVSTTPAGRSAYGKLLIRVALD